MQRILRSLANIMAMVGDEVIKSWKTKLQHMRDGSYHMFIETAYLLLCLHLQYVVHVKDL